MKLLKKMLGALLVPALLLSLAMPALAADVQRSGQKLTVDGVEVDCEKYNIDGSNYFKLRDLACLLSGTGSAFEVGWNAERQTVSITTGQDYTKVGGELEVGADLSAQAQVSTQAIVIDGKPVEGISVYNIGGNNYFKLRDLGEALGFDVSYDADTNTAVVQSVGQNTTGSATALPTDGERIVLSGMVGRFSYDEVVALQGMPDPNAEWANKKETFLLIVLDEPQSLELSTVDGRRSDTARMIYVYSTELESYVGQHIIFSIDPDATRWPSDTSMPLGQPRTSDIHVLG